jgi:hypothetical protein
MRTCRLAVALALLVLVGPFALAAAPPPVSGHVDAVDVGPAVVASWIGARDAAQEPAVLGGNVTIWFAVLSHGLSPDATAQVAYLNVTGALQGALFLPGGDSTVLRIRSAGDWTYASLEASVSNDTGARMDYLLDVALLEERANGTTTLFSGSAGTRSFAVVGAPVAAPAAGPRWAVPLALTLALVLVVGIGWGLKRRRDRAAMNALHRRRSQALRDEVVEKGAKKPEAAQRVQQEIRQVEQVREKRRELQILEAKRADALKTIDLLQKRREAGSLSQHQFDQMAAKKRVDLERIEADIAQMEREDSGSAA